MQLKYAASQAEIKSLKNQLDTLIRTNKQKSESLDIGDTTTEANDQSRNHIELQSSLDVILQLKKERDSSVQKALNLSEQVLSFQSKLADAEQKTLEILENHKKDITDAKHRESQLKAAESHAIASAASIRQRLDNTEERLMRLNDELIVKVRKSSVTVANLQKRLKIFNDSSLQTTGSKLDDLSFKKGPIIDGQVDDDRFITRSQTTTQEACEALSSSSINAHEATDVDMAGHTDLIDPTSTDEVENTKGIILSLQNQVLSLTRREVDIEAQQKDFAKLMESNVSQHKLVTQLREDVKILREDRDTVRNL